MSDAQPYDVTRRDWTDPFGRPRVSFDLVSPGGDVMERVEGEYERHRLDYLAGLLNRAYASGFAVGVPARRMSEASAAGAERQGAS